jgi:predicted aspartyl protease
MSIVRTEVTLKNALDVGKELEGLIKNHEIRQTTLQAMVDWKAGDHPRQYNKFPLQRRTSQFCDVLPTGAWTLVINEAVRNTLGLQIIGTDYGTLADGVEEIYNVAGPLEVIWKDRRTICVALVLPNADEVLLGAIPLEALDLTINPRREEVIGAHGDWPVHSVK